MAANYHWISYDARDDGRRRRRKWPWILLLLLLLAAILVGGWLWYESSEGIDLAQPVAIQTALPALLTDDTMVVYVVDGLRQHGGKTVASATGAPGGS